MSHTGSQGMGYDPSYRTTYPINYSEGVGYASDVYRTAGHDRWASAVPPHQPSLAPAVARRLPIAAVSPKGVSPRSHYGQAPPAQPPQKRLQRFEPPPRPLYNQVPPVQPPPKRILRIERPSDEAPAHKCPAPAGRIRGLPACPTWCLHTLTRVASAAPARLWWPECQRGQEVIDVVRFPG